MRKFVQTIISLIFLFGLIHPTFADIKKIKANLSDSVITTKITAKFTQNKRLNPLKISVSTRNGQVTLSGFVNDRNALLEAVKLTKATHGVHSVNVSHLIVKPVNTYFTDAYITGKVEAVLFKAKILDDESIPIVSINATTTNGVVTLSGEVKKPETIRLLVDKVKSIQGVNRVVTHLLVIKK